MRPDRAAMAQVLRGKHVPRKGPWFVQSYFKRLPSYAAVRDVQTWSWMAHPAVLAGMAYVVRRQ